MEATAGVTSLTMLLFLRFGLNSFSYIDTTLLAHMARRSRAGGRRSQILYFTIHVLYQF